MKLWKFEAYTRYTERHYFGIVMADTKENAEKTAREHIGQITNHIKWMEVRKLEVDKDNPVELICDYQDE